MCETKRFSVQLCSTVLVVRNRTVHRRSAMCMALQAVQHPALGGAGSAIEGCCCQTILRYLIKIPEECATATHAHTYGRDVTSMHHQGAYYLGIHKQ